MNRNAILCMDNAPSHIYDDTGFTNTKVVFLPPNLTSHIQPMDAGIIRAFKAHYRRLFILRALERYENGQDNIYNIDQLEGMNLAMEAWTYVSDKTIANCWRHAGILEQTPALKPSEDPPADTNGLSTIQDAGVKEAVDGLNKALSDLAVQQVVLNDLPTADELLNIADENVTEAVWSDDDIIEQVQLNAREERGEHVQELDDDEPVPIISASKALFMLSELDRFFQQNEGNECAKLRAAIPKARREIRREVERSKVQADIRSFIN